MRPSQSDVGRFCGSRTRSWAAEADINGTCGHKVLSIDFRIPPTHYLLLTIALKMLETGNSNMPIKQRKSAGGLKVHSKGRYGQIRYVEIGELTNSSNFRPVITGLVDELERKRGRRQRELAQERRWARLHERPTALRGSTGSSH